eukprot:gnl/Chilomastix_caulleri/60.p1 GENE.gnl/Chilomastix_caulleri/60~~gnl/Chilomastix_caulleri/60.p1  ORF type:complete len:371 (+),score=140.58 gnl/Chilomastix_caulleri/60:64-1176(+)
MVVGGQVKVFDLKGKEVKAVDTPAVFNAPIRTDIIHFIHTNMAKNSRQAYGLSALSGLQTPATSWGPGRAVARVPRVPGSGTRRCGQAARANFTRGGRMYGATQTIRRWHRKINVNQKRYAAASAISASAVNGFVSARGHLIEHLPQLPMVITNEIEKIIHTKDAEKLFRAIGLKDELERVKNSKTVRAGKGKARNRRFRCRVGPMVIVGNGSRCDLGFRNIPGVKVANVNSLSLIDLCPGGHPGRLLIWSENAVAQLNNVFGTTKVASRRKHGYYLPTPAILQPSIERIIRSDNIKSALLPKRKAARKIVHYNALKNKTARAALFPKDPKFHMPGSKITKVNRVKKARKAAKRAELLTQKKAQVAEKTN